MMIKPLNSDNKNKANRITREKKYYCRYEIIYY